MSIKEHPPHLHVPVLLDAVLDQLQPIQGESYLDLTAGYGGHASRVIDKTQNFAGTVLVDRDENAIRHLETFAKKGVTLLHTDFAAAAAELARQGRKFDMILVDLGVSSPQLDRAERGFSFTKSGPLDMRMDPGQEVSAETLVNTLSEKELVRIITTYGEEKPKLAQRIAAAIVAHRPLRTTEELAELISTTYVGRWQKIHPATRTFQAIRIAVNHELEQIEKLLPLLPRLLNEKGRVAIISFHSLEDRLVKQYFTEQKNAGYEAELEIVTKKPLAGSDYDVHNPRSRSSKLRVAVKK